MDFTKSIFENRKAKGLPFLAAHRGVCGANIPCNTLASFKIATDYGADVVEIDVAKTLDGKYYVFHPGMESVFLKSEKKIKDMTAEELEAMVLVNQDTAKTSYKVPTLYDVLTFLRGKAYINVDKFWTDVEGISKEIRRAGVENQVIVKTYTDMESLMKVKEFASDFMFIPMVRETDDITDKLIEMGINIVGVEVLFKDENAEIISDEYIKKMHDRGILIWTNSIIYNEKDVISAYHTDDISLTKSVDLGWGWLVKKNVDFIQTDWLLPLKLYLESL